MARLSPAQQGRPTSATSSDSGSIFVLTRRPPSAKEELEWLAAYKNRPPSGGESKKERSLPWEPGKLALWLERQPKEKGPPPTAEELLEAAGGKRIVTPTEVEGARRSRSAASRRPRSVSSLSKGSSVATRPAPARPATGGALRPKVPPPPVRPSTSPSKRSSSKAAQRAEVKDQAKSSVAVRASSSPAAQRSYSEKCGALKPRTFSDLSDTIVEKPAAKPVGGVDSEGYWWVENDPPFETWRSSSKPKVSGHVPKRKTVPAFELTEHRDDTEIAKEAPAVCFNDDVDDFGMETVGMWWEWQWFGPDGWNFFSQYATSQLEEAFTQGLVTCSVSHGGGSIDFNIVTGREVNGRGRIRRVRMPSSATHAVSTCSTFLMSTEFARASNWDHHASASVWTQNPLAESNMLSIQAEFDDEPEPPPSPSKTIPQDSAFGFSSNWTSLAQSPSARVKPARHGSNIKHREQVLHFQPSPSHLQNVRDMPLEDGMEENMLHVWRSEVYSSLQRIELD